MARVSLRLWIGVALIAAAMFWNAAWNQWADAHNWMPLLKPIALSAGYRASARFEIETPGTDFVALKREDSQLRLGLPVLCRGSLRDELPQNRRCVDRFQERRTSCARPRRKRETLSTLRPVRE